MMEGLNTILQSGNTHRIAKAKYEQAEAGKKNRNKVTKAQGDLATWGRSLNNQKRVNAAARQFNTQMMQITQEMKNATSQGSNLSLQHAEAMGAVRARAAIAGVGGSTVEAMENLVALQTATSEEELKTAVSNLGFFGKDEAARIVSDAYESQDFSQTVQQFDYSVNIAPKPLKYKWLKVAGVAAATYFGGPEAGKAAADAFVGAWQAENGDFAGSSQSWGNALQGGVQAMQDWSDRGGTAWGRDAFSGFRASGGGSNGKSFVKTAGGNRSSGVSNKKSNRWF